MAKAITDNGLRRINLIAGVLHLAQMVAVLALASDFTLPITARYMSGPPGSTYGDLIVLWDAPLAIGVAVFLGLSALAHFIVVSPKFFPRYIAGLKAHRNFFRWVEYSISSSVMIVLIAQVTGISEVTALISIFGVNASMILLVGCRKNMKSLATVDGFHLSSVASPA